MHSEITLTMSTRTTLQTPIHNICCPSQSILPSCSNICWAFGILFEHDTVAPRLAALSSHASTTTKPEPYRRSPCKCRVCGQPFRMVEKDILVTAELFTKLTVVGVPRQLLWTAAAVLFARNTWIVHMIIAIGLSCLFCKHAQTPSFATAIIW